MSSDLRTGRGDALQRRRRVCAMALSAAGSMGVVAAYQMGLVKHLPEPPLPLLDADKVDASGEAYQYLKTPDAAVGLASYATTMDLAGMGSDRRAEERPWIPLALAAKVGLNAVSALYLTVEQGLNHRRFLLLVPLGGRVERRHRAPGHPGGPHRLGPSPKSHLLSDPTLHRPALGAHRLLSDGRSAAP